MSGQNRRLSSLSPERELKRGEQAAALRDILQGTERLLSHIRLRGSAVTPKTLAMLISANFDACGMPVPTKALATLIGRAESLRGGTPTRFVRTIEAQNIPDAECLINAALEAAGVDAATRRDKIRKAASAVPSRR